MQPVGTCTQFYDQQALAAINWVTYFKCFLFWHLAANRLLLYLFLLSIPMNLIYKTVLVNFWEPLSLTSISFMSLTCFNHDSFMPYPWYQWLIHDSCMTHSCFIHDWSWVSDISFVFACRNRIVNFSTHLVGFLFKPLWSYQVGFTWLLLSLKYLLRDFSSNTLHIPLRKPKLYGTYYRVEWECGHNTGTDNLVRFATHCSQVKKPLPFCSMEQCVLLSSSL